MLSRTARSFLRSNLGQRYLFIIRNAIIINTNYSTLIKSIPWKMYYQWRISFKFVLIFGGKFGKRPWTMQPQSRTIFHLLLFSYHFHTLNLSFYQTLFHREIEYHLRSVYVIDVAGQSVQILFHGEPYTLTNFAK